MTRRPYKSGECWGIILAGGEGSRLHDLTVSRYGEARPKQYCAFLGKRSMFQHTMERAVGLVGRQRVITVIGNGHMRYMPAAARSEICGYIVEQPRNCDTGPGILLPLAYVLAHDPEATVMIFPSDHYISPNDLFMSWMDKAACLAERMPQRLILAAAVADKPETEYGWIQPGAAVEEEPEARGVLQFHEKPDAALAQRFYDSGYLWNTLNMAVKAKTLWSLGWKFQPKLMQRFESLHSAVGTGAERSVLSWIYEDMETVNFSRGILEMAADRALVLPMRELTWSDWGRPERIEQTLSRLSTMNLVENAV